VFNTLAVSSRRPFNNVLLNSSLIVSGITKTTRFNEFLGEKSVDDKMRIAKKKRERFGVQSLMTVPKQTLKLYSNGGEF